MEWTEQLDISKTGEYWAPRGPGKSFDLAELTEWIG